MAEEFDKEALAYHREYPPGKISVTATKPLSTQRDLSLAYSPGVAAACREIADNPMEASTLTARGNLVAVITNGTAVLGLGNIGPLASKPVMEGKGVLFKKFADIDVFDIEVDELDPDKFCAIVKALEPTFGGINLEDIKAPECFVIEKYLKENMNIPVFHDDQHGTAIIVTAGVYNALDIIGKKVEDIKIVCSGAGAAALACLKMLENLGAKRENITVSDRFGVLYKGREEEMDEYKEIYAKDQKGLKLEDVLEGADMFLGLSAGNIMTGDMVKKMADNPIIFALANPTPEILPEEILKVRDDAIIATGRSDYPNQVNNLLCFPFIFRGALDVGASAINEEMKLAASKAIAALARKEVSDSVANAYGETPNFGREYIIPKPFDNRLILEIAPAVAKAANESGVATRPIKDYAEYRRKLSSFVFRSGSVMKPIMDRAKQAPKRVAYAEGEEERVLRAIRTIVDEGLAFPILIGRRKIINSRIERFSLRLEEGKDYEICDVDSDERHIPYSNAYHELMGRNGVTPEYSKLIMRTRLSAIASMMVRKGHADSMICGVTGDFEKHVEHVKNIIGIRPDATSLSTINMLLVDQGAYFITDTHVNYDPSVETIVESARLAAEVVEKFGLVPRIALMSHSNFGSSKNESALKMREAVRRLQMETDYEVDGEMHADTALNPKLRESFINDSFLKGKANLLVMPNLDAANIAYNCAKMLGNALSLGPMLVGDAKPVHVLTNSTTVRNIINITALAVVDVQVMQEKRS